MPQPVAPAAAPADTWEAAAAAPSRSRTTPRATAAASPAAVTSRGGGAVIGAGAAEEDTLLQFGGGHVLELFDLTPAVRTQHLEAFLERLCSGHPAPPTLK